MDSMIAAARPTPHANAALTILLAVEATGTAAFALSAVDPTQALIGHVAVILGFLVGAKRLFGDDLTFYFLGALLAASTGPFGTAGVLVLSALLARTKVSKTDLEDWYRIISGTTEQNVAAALYDQLADGRTRKLASGQIEHFPTVLSGSLAKQQSLLGLIGLDYHPSYRSLLKQALRSCEPSIRVHAAAVSVKLRTRARVGLQNEFARQADETRDEGTLARAERLSELASGGFLDETESRQARELALTLCERELRHREDNDHARRLSWQLLADLQDWAKLCARLEDRLQRDRTGDRLLATALMQLGRSGDLQTLLKSKSDPQSPSSDGRDVEAFA